ncbi:MAG: DUF1640 domain-containing protein [Magnetococcales bacterium]|nr:DUF1640 domain-containing protein [Magnetococcales bacterium]
MTTLVVPFDTLAFVKKLETAGIPPAHAEAQAEALAVVLQKTEESRLQELATKGDLLRLERDIKELDAKVETRIKELELRMVIKMGAMILGGIGLLFGLMRAWPLPVQYVPTGQEMRMPAPVQPLPTPPGR